jgi:uncharacterized flavoprotein (TIGR03862 family)
MVEQVTVIGSGPAGLMAAEVMARGGLAVTVHEKMPSLGRKLLMAGRGGLNLTHSEPMESFVTRYGEASAWMRPYLDAFPPSALIEWCEGLGEPTFVGSSGRVFPKSMKASPLLRAWLRRLDGLGVKFRTRSEWRGEMMGDALVLALGGASWPRLGSDGGWTRLLPEIAITPLCPANCGFAVDWSDVFRTRFAGAPLKTIALTFRGVTVRGEAIITDKGIEGGAVYALSARLRDAIANEGQARLHIDLRPDVAIDKLGAPRGKASLSTYLRKSAGLSPVAIGLVQEALHRGDDKPVADLIKDLPLRLSAPFDIARAISTAGGIARSEVDARLMLEKRPGIFVAGEMLDWEAPTGGYLLQGCMATGAAAGRGVLEWLTR